MIDTYRLIRADAIEAEKRARLKVPDAVASTYQEQYDGQGFQVYDLHQLPLPDVVSPLVIIYFFIIVKSVFLISPILFLV